ncbi:hypothetical protein AVEN_1411-1 [Araneus ventricosus]|uniref:Uncharacterized protein n=1 Tax=Araneus ventricosus TaxID=182803 RepID=A0A4Y2TEQ7_ARAVE|nr:hypothetical protein AVEN_1411-1 [Araneus ventricosus]
MTQESGVELLTLKTLKDCILCKEYIRRVCKIILLKFTRAYRTNSTQVLNVLTGIPPSALDRKVGVPKFQVWICRSTEAGEALEVGELDYNENSTNITLGESSKLLGLGLSFYRGWSGAGTRRKGVDGFSVETAGAGNHPFSKSSDSLTDAWELTVHKLCITKLFVDYMMHSSFAYREVNSNFTCGDLKILPYEFIHSRNRGSVGHNVSMPRTWQVLDAYASRLITLISLEYGATREEVPVRTPLSSCDKFVKHSLLLHEEIG